MSWEIAFTVVGCLWAFVFLIAIRTQRMDENERRLNDCEKQWVAQARDIEFLKSIWRGMAERCTHTKPGEG